MDSMIDPNSLMDMLSKATDKTNSEVTLAIVVVGIILLLAIGVFGTFYLRTQKEKNAQESERYKQGLEERSAERDLQKRNVDVLQNVSEALGKLTTVIEMSTTQSHSSFERVHLRIDEVIEMINKDITVSEKILSTLARKPRVTTKTG